ncbi:hypothetical protein EEAAV_27620 (plasmid) [Rahnella aceris]
MLFKQVNRMLHHAGRIVVFNNFRISQPVGQAFHQGIVADFFTCQKNAGRRVSNGIFDVREENKLFGKAGINDYVMPPAVLSAPLSFVRVLSRPARPGRRLENVEKRKKSPPWKNPQRSPQTRLRRTAAPRGTNSRDEEASYRLQLM